MNYKSIVKQTELQHKAIAAVKKTEKKEKTYILKQFSKPIFDYLLYIQKSPRYRFSAEPHFNKDRHETRPLFNVWKADIKPKDPYAITSYKEAISKGMISDMLTNELSYASGSIKIYFRITDEFTPSIYYEFGKQVKQFFEAEDFIKSFTELLLKYTK